MHASSHGAIGIVIVTAAYLITNSEKKTYIVAGFFAFVSHYILDFIGEAAYKSMQEMLLIEFAVFLWSMIFMSFLGVKYVKFAIFGHCVANLMDYIDKKMYLAIFFPKEYSFTYYFHSKNQVLIPISYKETIVAAIVSMMLTLSCFLLLKYKKKQFN